MEFNLTLLKKWWRRMLEEKGSLWYTVLVAKYGVKGANCVVEGEMGLIGGRILI